MITGGTGSGKTSSIIAANFLQKTQGAGVSRCYFDPKSNEMTETIGRHLASLGRLDIWAPYGFAGKLPSGAKISKLNMLAPLIDKKTPRNRRRMIAKSIADGIVLAEDGKNAYFARNARELGADCILAAVDVSDRPDRLTLPGIMKDVCADFEGFCERIADTDHSLWSPVFEGHLRSLKRGKGFEDVLGTLTSESMFLRDEGLIDALSGDDIHFDQMGADVMSVGICLPLELLAQASKVNRMIASFALGQTINSLRPRKTKIDLWFEECASYGKLDDLVAAYRTGRAYGVRIWTCWTDVGSLENVYGEGDAASMRANSSIQIYFPGKDIGSAMHVSKQGGARDVVNRSKSVSYDREGWPTMSESWGQHQREVMTVGEFQDLDPNCHLMWVRGVPGVIKAKHKPYFKQWRYRGRFDKNSLYGRQ